MTARSGARVSWLEVGGPLVGYAVLTAIGATTSSLALLSQDPSAPRAHQVGQAMAIRTDEWQTEVPIELGTLASGYPPHSTLSQQPDLLTQIPSGGFFESILFAEGNLLRLGAWLPEPMLFAAFRGFPWLLFFVCLPLLLQRLGATRPMAWFATVLCFFAPASLWWSFIPIRILAFAAAGCYLVFVARDLLARRRNWPGVLVAVLAGVCLARLVTFYVPWSLTLGVPLVVATGCYLACEGRERRSALLAVGIAATAAAGVLAGTFWENWPALQSMLGTVYPGQRRSSGAPQSLFQLFGAPGLSELEAHPEPKVLNQSEISSAFLVCGVWAALLWRLARGNASREQWAAVRALGVAVLLFASWTMFPWGAFGAHVPLLNTLLPSRAAQTVGFPATILLALVLSRVPQVSWQRALVVAATCAVLTAGGVLDLRRALPGVSGAEVAAAALATGFFVYFLTRLERRALPVLGVTVVAALAAVGANPLVLGLGELRESPPAALARDAADDARSHGTLWAADTPPASALLVANGVPLLTGYQLAGPVVSEWERLDPEHSAESVWNRGASYLHMDFRLPDDATSDAPVITQLGNDGILVHVDPCWLASSDLRVTHVLASTPVDSPCAEPVSSFVWFGEDHVVYALGTP